MDELFGNIFDFNGDDRTDAIEMAIGFQIMEEAENGDEEEI